MTNRLRITSVIILLLAVTEAFAADVAQTMALPKPRTSRGSPLLDALAHRQSVREYAATKIPDQLLSDLLWAACGVNRPDSGKRTAPSTMNSQEIDIYVAREDGLFRFQPETHSLTLIMAKDLRALTGRQPFLATAPIDLIYVADLTRLAVHKPSGGMSENDGPSYAFCDTGFIAQNLYLFCASEGLGTVVVGNVDRDALGSAMGIQSTQRITLTQPVGYPKKP